MSNVAPLHEGIKVHEGKPNEALVAELKIMLDSAERGHLQSLIGTGFTSDGLRYSCWCDFHDNRYQMLGSLQWICAEYVERHTRP
jgi:hypothetical protein